MTDIVEKLGQDQAVSENPSVEISTIKLWVFSIISHFIFPISLRIFFVVPGSRCTNQLVSTLVRDFLHITLIVLLIVVLAESEDSVLLSLLFGG